MNMLRNYLLSFILIVLQVIVHAQNTSVFGRFEVEYAAGCAPFTVHINEIDNLGDIAKTYTFENGVTATSDTFYTYTDPGRYQIIQLLGEDIVPKTDTLTIEVFENEGPLFQGFYCSSNEIILKFPDTTYDSYFLVKDFDTLVFDQANEWADALSIVDSAAVNIQGRYENAAPNCILLDTVFFPGPLLPDLNPSFSYNYVCSDVVLLHLSHQPNPGQLFEIKVNQLGQPDQSIYLGPLEGQEFILDSINTATLTDELCVTINAISACDSTVSRSYLDCVSLDSYREPIDYAYSYFIDDRILVNFDTSSSGEYRLSYLENGNSQIISPIESPVNLEWNNPSEAPEFELIFNANCPGDSSLLKISPPFIKRNKTGINQFELALSPPNYYFSNDTITSDSLIYTGQLNDTTLDTRSTSFRLNVDFGQNQALQYAYFIDSISLFSNKIDFQYEYYVYVPDAFTPNDDGLNDTFNLYGLPTDDFTLKIFNRWGEKVFESSDVANMWNGRLNNGHIVEGVYVYQLKFYNSIGELFTQQGSFAVIRD